MPSRKIKRQTIYKMKGCSKKNKSQKRKHLGGSNKIDNLDLAYTGKPIFSLPNPNLAYTGSTNTNAENPVYPNTGPIAIAQNWLNSSIMRGGSCGGTCSLQKGGAKHRSGCKCSNCKIQKGGNGLPFGKGLPEMNGTPYPNGLTGQSWEPNLKWPGTNNIGGDYNHYSNNTYKNDVPNQIINTGAQPPFSLKGGKTRRNKKHKGGATSNLMFQDLVNVGRQFQYGLGTTYNALRGFEAPVSPMPWQNQMSNKNIK